MTERREDLSTADLAAQQPTDTTPPDWSVAADVQRRDPPTTNSVVRICPPRSAGATRQ
jgi:hypothetical protein